MSYPTIKKVKIPNPCVGVCSTSTVASIYCVGCNRHYKDIIAWNAMDDGQKILAMKRATNHNTAKLMGLVDGDNIEYDEESIYNEVSRRLRKAFAETGPTESN